MKKLLFIAFCCLASLVGWAQPTNCPPGYVPRPQQDCPGAIRLCSIRNFIPNDALCGRGAVNDSFQGSCGTRENITTFYQFTAQRDGILQFVIVPTDVDTLNCADWGEACGSTVDYDFVLYRLPTGINGVSPQVCRLINRAGSFGTPNPLQVRCDFSGLRGITGCMDSAQVNATPDISKFDSTLFVRRGETFVLAVDNWSNNPQVGYTIIFGDPDANSRLTDVRNSILPEMEAVIRNPNCYNDTLLLRFNTEILCNQVNTQTFEIRNSEPRLAGQLFPIRYIAPATPCGSNASGANLWKVVFGNMVASDSFTIGLRGTIQNLCGRSQDRGRVPFKLPFLSSEARVGSVLSSQILQDSVCVGNRISVRAVLDDSVRRFGEGVFAYAFYERDPITGALVAMPANGFNRDSLRIISSFPQAPVKTIRNFVIIGTPNGPNPNGCVDTAYQAIRVLPIPEPPTLGVPPLCFGESFTLNVHAPEEQSKYAYTWTTSVPNTGATDVTPRLSLSGTITFIGDTTNAVNTEGTEVRRGETDGITFEVQYKRQFGGCRYYRQVGTTRQFVFPDTIRVGAYARPQFSYDSIIRPGKARPTFILPLLSFYDESVVRTVNNGNRVAGTLPQTWTFFSNTNNQLVNTAFFPRAPRQQDSVVQDFRRPFGEGNYTVTQIYRDTVTNAKVCEYRYAASFEMVLPDVPNVMSRNNDNLNDYFEIPDIIKVYQYRLTVFNRWGRKVYEQANYDNTFNGTDLEDGVYFYNLKPENGPGREYRGWLELRNQSK